MSTRAERQLAFTDPGAFVRRGFTLLELVAVIALIGVLLAFALDRLLPYFNAAERVGVLTLERQIRSVLMVSAARRIAGGESARLSELDRSNPMSLMLETPANYAGELGPLDVNAVPARRWYFNLQTRRLVYHPGQPFGWLNNQEIDDPEFEVQVAYDDRDGNGSFDPGRDAVLGVRLQRAAGIEWLAGAQAALQ